MTVTAVKGERVHFDPRHDGFGFVVTVDDVNEHHVSVTARYVTGRGMAGNGTSQYAPLDVDADTEPYLDAYMKWDGCMHFYFNHGDEEGYYHWCGVRDLMLHCDLIRYLHRKAYEWMGREPERGEEWPK